jgi:Ca-activated chloride channel family protein
MTDGDDYYRLLNIDQDANQEEIKSAYFEAARRYHPDTNPSQDAQEKFLKIQAAYDTLSDPDKRKSYDTRRGPVPDRSVAIKVEYSRSMIPVLKENQVVYALVEYVSTSEPENYQQPPLNICLVVDRSTSMKGERMDMVKANITQLIRKLSPSDSISVISFSDRAEVVVPLTKVQETDRIIERVSLIEANGGTEIYQGIELGLTQMKRNSHGEEIRHMFLLTDGHTYGDEGSCLELAESAAKDGIIISALGIGTDWNDRFLDRVTGLTGGDTLFVSSRNDLFDFLDKKINAIGLVYAQGVQFDFTLGPGIELRYAIRLMPEVSPLPTSSPIFLGNLRYGKRQRFLLELLVPEVYETNKIIKLASAKLKMHISTANTDEEFSINMRRAVSSTPISELPPPDIIDALSRLTLYRLQEKARLEVEDGNIPQATKHLQYLATQLLSYGDRELAHSVLREAEHIQQSHRFSNGGDKQIKYGTRALLLPEGLENES